MKANVLPVRRIALGMAVALIGLSPFHGVPSYGASQPLLTGEAGAWAFVTLSRATPFSPDDNPVVAVTGSRGRLAGFVLQRADVWGTYTIGRTDAPCPYAATRAACPVAHVPSVISTAPANVLPSGRYRVALVGEPGSKITVRLDQGAIRERSLKWAGRGRIAIAAGTVPGPADHHVVADDRFAFQPGGAGATTVVGSVVRIDIDNVHETRVSFCARSKGLHDTLPGGVACDGDDVTSSDGKYSSGKGVCAGCFPAAAPFSLTEAASAVLAGPAPEIRVHARVLAQRSRISVTAFGLALPPV